MKNPFKTGRLVTDRLLSKVSAFCLVCMAILLPLCGAYVGLRNGYNRQNALAERTRERGYKILERCDTSWGEVEAMKKNLTTALSVASQLECPEQDDLLELWEECKRDVECKRKDSRREAHELSASVKSALESYRKAKNQVNVFKCVIEEDAKPKAEKIMAIDIDLRERICSAIASLKSELSRPLPVNTVSVGEYLKSCIGLVEINEQEKVRELESRCCGVEAVLADVDINRGDAESMSHRLNDVCDKIKNTLKEMKAQKEAGQKAYNAFLVLPMNAGLAIAQFRQKHLTPLKKQIEEMDEQFGILIERWRFVACQESLEKIQSASNVINSATALFAQNRVEMSQSMVEFMDGLRSQLNERAFALNKSIEDFNMGQKKITILKHLANLKDGYRGIEKEFEIIENSEAVTDDISRMLIDKVGKIKLGEYNIADEISEVKQHIDDISNGELKKLDSVIVKFNDAVAKIVETLPKVDYEVGWSAMCIPFSGNHNVETADIEEIMKRRDGEVVTGYCYAIPFDKFNLENEAKNDFMSYRVFRFDFSIERNEINELESIVLKLSKDGHTLRKGSNKGFLSKLKVNCSLRVKGIELSQRVLQDKGGIDKNRSDSVKFLISLKDSRQIRQYVTFSLLVWISPYRETGWNYNCLSAEIFGITTQGNKNELSFLHEVSR